MRRHGSRNTVQLEPALRVDSLPCGLGVLHGGANFWLNFCPPELI
jgi:hypothetical protein